LKIVSKLGLILETYFTEKLLIWIIILLFDIVLLLIKYIVILAWYFQSIYQMLGLWCSIVVTIKNMYIKVQKYENSEIHKTAREIYLY
jgi:hypothetical protein